MVTVDPRLLSKAQYRCIGPTRGGRVVAVAADPVKQNVFYFGGVAGGVWRSDDAGLYWEPITDGQLTASSIGALAVAPSDGNVIYAGTGEATIRIDVTHGDGVYKSTDGGKNWAHIGLADSRHIGELVVHPDDPDTVYVAALGHAFRESAERGSIAQPTVARRGSRCCTSANGPEPSMSPSTSTTLASCSPPSGRPAEPSGRWIPVPRLGSVPQPGRRRHLGRTHGAVKHQHR